jgi:hypothetical protein
VALSVALWACTRPNAAYCDEDTPCADPGMACNVELRECVATGLDGDTCVPGACPTRAPICDEETAACRGCATGQVGDDECAALDPDAPICSGGVCVGCERPLDCPSPAPWCSDNECIPCSEGPGGDTICSQRDPGEPYCLDGACVVCRSNADCADSSPVCEPDEGVCRGCERGSECETGVCDTSSGSCAQEDEILYVDGDAGQDGEGCGASADPCATISGNEGALAQAEGESAFIFVRAREGARYPERIVLDSGYVAIVGEGEAFGAGGAGIQHDGTAPIIELSGSARLRLEGVRLVGDLDIGESGIKCASSELELERVEIAGFGEHAVTSDGCTLSGQSVLLRASRNDLLRLASDSEARLVDARVIGGSARGIASQGGLLELHRARVEGNAMGGVVVVDSVIDLVNNVIVGNGTVPESELGGVRVRHSQRLGEEARFAFNTVAGNRASGDNGGLAHGVDCDGSELRATSNIVYTGVGGLAAVSAGCGWTWVYSNVQDGLEIDPDSENFSQDPGFVDAAAGNYQLQADSPCVGRGEPDTGVIEDLTGAPRPSDAPPSCGAYEP